MDIKNKLIEAYKDNDLVTYKTILEEYLSEGYAVDFDMIYYLIELLINYQQYEEAYPLIKILEKNIDNKTIFSKICYFYHCCFKPKEAERIFKSKNLTDYLLLVRIYLFEGKIEEAKELLNDIKESIPQNQIYKYTKYQEMIDNHINYGAYIETEYESFKEKGNKLEEGHIVYLKQNPISKVNMLEDKKSIKRPYMIWKIEKNIIYIFPVSTSVHDSGYKLYAQKYPNINQDRIIKSHLCTTDINNVLSVKDKVLDEDYYNILKSIFIGTYFDRSDKEKNYNKKFINDYIGIIDKYDIAELVDKKTKEHTYYLVINIKDNHYKIVKLDLENNKIINDKILIIKDKNLIYRIIKPTNEFLQDILPQISEVQELPNLSWRKIKIGNIEYIVIEEDEKNCYVINAAYSASFIMKEVIKKDDIDIIGDIVSEEESARIQNILNDPSNKRRQLRKRK